MRYCTSQRRMSDQRCKSGETIRDSHVYTPSLHRDAVPWSISHMKDVQGRKQIKHYDSAEIARVAVVRRACDTVDW